MIEIIESIFNSKGFELEKSKSGTFCKTNNLNLKTQYWFIIKARILSDILENQSELYLECLSLCNDNEINKNLSLLIIYETNSKIDEVLDREIIVIEEDPYYFKKYILNFTTEQEKELKGEISGENITKKIEAKVTDSEVFALYKSNFNQKDSWTYLLYAITHKIPFLEINIQTDIDLLIIFEEKNKIVAQNNAGDFDNKIFTLIGAYSNEALQDIEPEDLLENILIL